MSNFSANRIVSRTPSLRLFFAFLTTSVLLLLQQKAYCQDNGPDTLKFAEPEHFDFSKPIVIIKHEPDIEKAKEYCKMAAASDNIDTIMKYAVLSLE